MEDWNCLWPSVALKVGGFCLPLTRTAIAQLACLQIAAMMR
jgi:hypothetical protein